jgi:hypothetical protein
MSRNLIITETYESPLCGFKIEEASGIDLQRTFTNENQLKIMHVEVRNNLSETYLTVRPVYEGKTTICDDLP